MEADLAFASLFRGYEQRYGRFEITGKKSSGKIEGIAKTVDAPPVAALYAEHLRGDAGLGIIPLTEDNKAYFAAIDVDKYDISLAALAKRIEKMPLVLTESKSGGAHLWLFIKDGAPASLVVEVLKLWAGELGFGGCEIFPKQTERASPNDVGNWINLPYFGGRRQYVTADGVRHPIETFLDVVFGNETTLGRRVTQQWLEDHGLAVEHAGPKVTGELQPDFTDGPPCFEQMLSQGIPDGTRNESFFNMAVYLLRKYEDREVVKRKLHELNEAHDIGLERKEIDTLVGSAAKKEYGYKCTVSPLKDSCQRAKCLKRDFGVGKKRDSGMDGSEVLRAVAQFNEEYAIVQVQGGIEYVQFTAEGPRFIEERAIRRWEANRTVLVNGVARPLFDVWLTHPNRRQYSGVVVEKEYSGPALNMWSGYGVEPSEGDVSLWHEYLHHMSGGDTELARWVEHYSAHIAQNPTSPSVPSALVFKGRQGQGKSHWGRLMRAAMPNCVTEISDAATQLMGRFNRRFMAIPVLLAEEAIFEGDRRVASKLKTFISSHFHIYEEKFGAAIEGRNIHRICATTNHDHAVLVEDDDRRWTIVHTPERFDLSTQDGRKQAWKWWQPHYDFARDGGPALLHHLLSVEVDVPFISFGYRTAAKGDDKISSDPLLQMLMGIAEDGELPGDTQGKGVVSNSNLSEAMREAVQGSYGKAIPAESIGQRVKKLVPSCTAGVRNAQYVKHEGFTSDGVPRTTTKGSQRGIQFGSLLELRQDLERIVGPREWNGPQTWQQWRVASAMEEPPF